MLRFTVGCCCAVSVTFKLRHQLKTILFALTNIEIQNVECEIDGLECLKMKSILQHLHGENILKKRA